MSTRASAPVAAASQPTSRLDRVLRTGQAHRAATVCTIGKPNGEEDECNGENDSAWLRKIAGLSCSQDVAAPYDKVQLGYTKNSIEKEEHSHKTLENRLLQGITKEGDKKRSDHQLKRAIERISARKKDLKAVEYWQSQDFHTTRVPTAEEMFECTGHFAAFRAIVGNSGPLKEYDGATYPVLAPGWDDWYWDTPYPVPSKEEQAADDQRRIAAGRRPARIPLDYVEQNLDWQASKLDDTYKAYVNEHTKSGVIELWTREMDASEEPPPHKQMEAFLLDKAFKSKRNPMVLDARHTTEQLYNMVTKAPRCPHMMSFIRVVRNDKRLPLSWFKRKYNQEMQPGESVMLPVFMSTSNTHFKDSWASQGPFSDAAAVDDTDGTVPTVYSAGGGFDPNPTRCCCIQVIVTKGTPMLPLWNFKSNEHSHEQEVLLPPGVELVLLSRDDVVSMGGNEDVTICTFITRIGEPDTTLAGEER